MENKEVQEVNREGREAEPFPEHEHYEQIQKKLNKRVGDCFMEIAPFGQAGVNVALT